MKLEKHNLVIFYHTKTYSRCIKGPSNSPKHVFSDGGNVMRQHLGPSSAACLSYWVVYTSTYKSFIFTYKYFASTYKYLSNI